MTPIDGTGSRARAIWLAIRAFGAFGLSIGLIIYLVAGLITFLFKEAEWRPVSMIVGVLALGFAALSVVVWLVALLVSWWLLGPRRWTMLSGRERRERLLALYDQAVSEAARNGLQLARVRRVYMSAKNGTKAIIEFPDGTQTDAWFWWRRVSPGDVLLVQGDTGWGPHHDRAVLYSGSKHGGHGIAGSIPLAAWRAHRRRAAGR